MRAPRADRGARDTDAEALLASDADVVCYTATGDLRPQEAVEDMCRFLAAGKHVVATSVVSLVYPPSAPSGWVRQLEAACREGDTACFTSGIDPGFANDLLPLVVSGFSERIDTIRIVENLDYSTYMQPEVLFDTMGFGQPPESTPLLLVPGALTFAWGGVLHMIAAGLGEALDEVREVVERFDAPHDFTTAVGEIRAGTMAALRFEVQGWIRGRPAIVVEHVTRMHPDMAPDWPAPPGHGGYQLSVTGSPSYTLDLQMMGEDGDHNTGGLVATGMRILERDPGGVRGAAGRALDDRPPARHRARAAGLTGQFSVGSSAAVANSARRPRWRRSTSRQSVSGALVTTSPTSASTTIQSPWAISPSSCAGPHPA